MKNPFKVIGGLFKTAEADVAKAIKNVSPFVLEKIKPILVGAEEQLWQTAWPLAVNIVKNLAKQTFSGSGLDLHKAGVQQLEQALIAAGRTALNAAEKAQLGQIILAAFVTAVIAAI